MHQDGIKSLFFPDTFNRPQHTALKLHRIEKHSTERGKDHIEIRNHPESMGFRFRL